MKNEENQIFSETAKTVLFVHAADKFTIDQSITSDAVIIQPPKKEWEGTGEVIFYYMQLMREAAKSGKNYIIMEYEPIIGATIEALIKAPEQYNFISWQFDTFFHADTCPEGVTPDPMYNANDEKMEILLGFYHYPFIWKYTIPVGYNLTLADLQRLKKDYSEPETPEEFELLMSNLKKGIKPTKLFPFYEADYEKLMDYANRREKEG